jgi:L-aminopeptidase/D-esterase-like protein
VQGSNLTLTAVPGVRVGHATDTVGATGCTAILVDGGAAAAARVLGGAVGSRQFAALEPGHVAPRVHGVLLAGGSAFGLDAGGGALRFLEERGIGLATPAARVPIVPTLVIYDLGCGDAQARPDAAMGYAACAAASAAPVAEGCVGAGTGATVGKLRGVASATKGGVGSAVESTADGVVAGALVVCNAFGDVVDPRDRRVVAGARADDGRGFLGTSGAIVAGALRGRREFGQHTTLVVAATNAALDRDQVGRAAALAATALPLCIDPVHTMLDGDVVVGLATGAVPAEPHQVGLLWRAAILAAVLRAVTAAETLHGVPAARDLAASAVRT